MLHYSFTVWVSICLLSLIPPSSVDLNIRNWKKSWIHVMGFNIIIMIEDHGYSTPITKLNFHSFLLLLLKLSLMFLFNFNPGECGRVSKSNFSFPFFVSVNIYQYTRTHTPRKKAKNDFLQGRKACVVWGERRDDSREFSEKLRI